MARRRGGNSNVEGVSDAPPPENQCVMPKVQKFFMDRDRVNMFFLSAVLPLIFIRGYTGVLQSGIMLMVSDPCYRLQSGRVFWLVNSAVYIIAGLLFVGYLILRFIWRIFE